MTQLLLLAVTAVGLLAAIPADSLKDPREVHLRNLRQLTTGGKNAEAYFSFAGDMLCFQSSPAGSA